MSLSQRFIVSALASSLGASLCASVSSAPQAAPEAVDSSHEFTVGSVRLQAYTEKSRTGSRVWGVRVPENGFEFNAASGCGSWFKTTTKAAMIEDLQHRYSACMKHGDRVANENRWRANFDLPLLAASTPQEPVLAA